jgi:hypothetical protein
MDIQSSQHILAYNLEGCQYKLASMNKPLVHLLLDIDCLDHKVKVGMDSHILVEQLLKNSAFKFIPKSIANFWNVSKIFFGKQKRLR